MSDLGDMLRRTREKRGLAVPEIAIETRIRGKLIIALEAGDYQQLPPEPFVRGLLKNYARFLGLEPDLVLDAYAIETGIKPSPTALTGPPEIGTDKVGPDVNEPPPVAQPPEAFVLPPAFLKREGAARPTDDGHLAVTTPSNPAAPAVQPRPEEMRTRQITIEPQESVKPSERTLVDRDSALRHMPPPPPTFQVAPDEHAEPTPANDKGVWIHRIAASRAPELVAAVAVAVAIFGLAAFGYSRLFVSGKSISQVATVVTKTPSIVAQRATTAFPTPVPTFEPTALVAIRPSPTVTKASAGTPAEADSVVPGAAQMEIQISGADPAVWAWVIVDDVEVFKGNILNDTKTWDARARLYIQVKDLPNGSVTFNGKSILPRVFAERKILERSWQMSSNGTPEVVELTPIDSSPTPSPTQGTSNSGANSPPSRTAQPTQPVPSETPTPALSVSPSPSPTGTIPGGAFLQAGNLEGLC